MPWYEIVTDKKYRLASSNIGHQVRNLVATDPAAWEVFHALEPHGNVYAVGGIVRDVVLGKTPKDVDLMVQGMEPQEVEDVLKQLPGRVDLTGESFGVFRYRDPEGNEVEVALPRTERSTGPGHRDFEVVTDPYISVGEDLGRRDFTANAMAVNLATGDLVDPYHGAEHAKSGILEPVSDRTFVEDPLRILRAFSAVSRHGLLPSDAARRDLNTHAGSLKELPQERLQMELDKIMSGDDPSRAIDLMDQSGVLHHVLPDVAATTGFDQKNPHHAYPLDQHLREVLDNMVTLTDDLDLRWAALLHDIGKPASQWIDDAGVGHYYQNELGQGKQHEEVGADQARQLLTNLKFPTDRIDRICHLIKHHMFPAFNSSGGARKFINRAGEEHADDLMRLRMSDQGGKGMKNLEHTVPLMNQYVQKVRDAGEPTALNMLAINGNDLIGIGFQPGPALGATLKYLLGLVIEDPSLNDKATLLEMARVSMSYGPKGAEPYLSSIRIGSVEGLYFEHEYDPDWGDHLIYAIMSGADTAPTVGQPLEGVDGEKRLPGGEVVGMIQVNEDSHGIRHIEVHPDYQRRGIATALYDEARKYVDPISLNNDYSREGAAWANHFSGNKMSKHPRPDLWKLTNVLDPIQDDLDPDVFNHPELVDPTVKPKIVEWVKKKVYTTLLEAGWPDPRHYLGLMLTGSLTTYQWSAESDFDISVWVDVERMPEYVRADLISLMIEHCDGTIVPGTTHPLQCFVVDPQKFKKGDLYQPGLRSAYDLDHGEWYVLPEKQRSIDVAKRWPEHIRYAQGVVDKMKMMLRYDKYAVKTYWKFLHEQRRRDMIAGKGDYALSNIVYKMMANEGLFGPISEATGMYIA